MINDLKVIGEEVFKKSVVSKIKLNRTFKFKYNLKYVCLLEVFYKFNMSLLCL